MEKELIILQKKYAINLFDWYSFIDKIDKKEKSSRILVFGDMDEDFLRPLLKRVSSIDLVIATKDYASLYNYLNISKDLKVYDDLASLETDIKEEDMSSEDILNNKYEKNTSFKNKYKDQIENLYKKLKIKSYDYVLIPDLNEKYTLSFGDGSLKSFMDFCIKEFTLSNGAMLIAFDNLKSINYLAGEKMEPGEVRYNIDDINEAKTFLKENYEKSDFSLYFPLPEYKFPLRIYSEEYMPKLVDEDDLTRNLVNMGMFTSYASSYIITFECDNTYKEDDDKLLYVKYNLNRNKKFALRTSIVRDKEGIKKVIKKAMYEEANEHVRNIVLAPELIDNRHVVVLKPIEYKEPSETSDHLGYIAYPFVEGEMVTDIILRKIKEGDNLKIVVTEYMYKLIGKLSGKLKNYNLDCTFSNAIEKDGIITCYDSEWIFNDTIDVDFLRYRVLKYFYKSCKQYLRYNTFKDMLRDFNINFDDAERFENAENKFQSEVHENINNLDVEKYNDARMNYSKFYYVKAELDRVKEQLENITGENEAIDYMQNKQNEVLRLTNVHVSNLETIIRNQREEINALAEQAAILNRRESLIYKVMRRVKKYVLKFCPPETKRSKIFKYIYRTMRHPLKMLKTFFTREGRDRIRGDFLIGDAYFECGKVTLPNCENIKVSIVIPCYNQIRYTYKCLYSIMVNTDENITPYEVIIADDNSTDKTKNIKKYINNCVVSRNEENLGFLKNCNKAASIARGEYIYFLNNDTEVKPHYLDSLVKLIENDDSIGMVGSKLIFADGTLQEAGGIIWSDGTGANYGRGDDPKAFMYNYVKDVDYISGAAIMIRKSLWDAIGGFDERFAPAYCEDSDLAFNVRKFGSRVVYEPLSEVIHYEGVSNGTDTSDTNSIKSYQVENNKKLKEKWEHELMNQFPKTDNPNFYKARERGMDKKVVLFIDHYVPTWDKDAGSRTVFEYVKMFLKKGYSVKFLGDNYGINSPYGEVLQQMGVEVLYGNNLQAHIWNYLKDNKRYIDYVFLNRPHIAGKYIDFIRQYMSAKIIYYGHDLHYLRLLREYDVTRSEDVLNESKYYRRLEYSLLYKSDLSYYPSYIEVDEIRSVDDTLKVKPINAYMFDPVDTSRRDFSNTKDLLFVGGFSHDPNVDAIKYFDEFIMPRLRSRDSSINLIIVGSNPTDEIKKIAEKSGYKLMGFVSDEELDKLYKNTRIVIAPLRYGAGIKGKIIEAMSKGAAIITTECGAEGIVDAKKFMKIADGALDFYNEIIKLYYDKNALEELSIKAREEINNRFTMEKAWEVIKEDFGVVE